MFFDHYGGEAALLATDLANARPALGPTDLNELFTNHKVMPPHLPTPPQTAELLAWGRQLNTCFGVDGLPLLVERVNALLAEGTCRPYISMHSGDPHLHFNSGTEELVPRIRAMTAAGLAHVISMAGPGRLGRCARPTCALAFLDTSRNGRRSYCTVRCANNEAVARHRTRIRTRTPAPS
jgi:hypothetical protein